MRFDFGHHPLNVRRAARWAAGFALVAAMVLPAAPVALAVHDVGVLELDGNIADGAVAGTDWAALFNASGGRTEQSLRRHRTGPPLR